MDEPTAPEDTEIIEDEASTTKEPQEPLIQRSLDSIPPGNAFQIKPSLEDKFKETPVKEVIRSVMAEMLTGKAYSTREAKLWASEIADAINLKLRHMRMKRYKHVVQVVLGELRGAGIKCGVRCLWDPETDGYTSDTFMNETLFCVTVVFAVYLY